MLELEQEVSNVDPNTPAGAQNPNIQQRGSRPRSLSRTRVGDAGRLIQSQRSLDTPGSGRRRRPCSHIVQAEGDAITKSELLIMITPHIVHTSNDAARSRRNIAASSSR